MYNTECWQGHGASETLFYILGGNVKWKKLENDLAASHTKPKFTLWPSKPTSRYLVKINENIGPQKDVFTWNGEVLNFDGIQLIGCLFYGSCFWYLI